MQSEAPCIPTTTTPVCGGFAWLSGQVVALRPCCSPCWIALDRVGWGWRVVSAERRIKSKSPTKSSASWSCCVCSIRKAQGSTRVRAALQHHPPGSSPTCKSALVRQHKRCHETGLDSWRLGWRLVVPQASLAGWLLFCWRRRPSWSSEFSRVQGVNQHASSLEHQNTQAQRRRGRVAQTTFTAIPPGIRGPGGVPRTVTWPEEPAAPWRIEG